MRPVLREEGEVRAESLPGRLGDEHLLQERDEIMDLAKVIPASHSRALRYFSAHCCAWKQTAS